MAGENDDGTQAAAQQQTRQEDFGVTKPA